LPHAAIYDYRLEPGVDIIIALTRRNLVIALNLVISILLSLTHAAIYDYRLEPGDIDIIIALTRRNSVIALNLVISILSP
jgi:hypothetical protein